RNIRLHLQRPDHLIQVVSIDLKRSGEAASPAAEIAKNQNAKWIFGFRLQQERLRFRHGDRVARVYIQLDSTKREWSRHSRLYSLAYRLPTVRACPHPTGFLWARLDMQHLFGINVIEFHGKAFADVVGGPLIFIVRRCNSSRFASYQVLHGTVQVTEIDDHSFRRSKGGGCLFHRRARPAHANRADIKEAVDKGQLLSDRMHQFPLEHAAPTPVRNGSA